ncbi:MAG TPA: hypothetical protein VM529_16440 [Gemmata sp.]|nr:hypothetical protein [Gemmata sp.]
MGRKVKDKDGGPEFAFRAGSRVSGVKPEVAAAELAAIRERDGGLAPAAVVEAARPEGHPLHAAFEWDDTKAGHEYRLWQARSLIRAVVVTHEDRRPEPLYVHVRTEDGGAYQPVSAVVRDVDMFAAAVEELAEKLAGSRRALDELRAVAAREGHAERAEQVEAVGGHLQAATAAAERIR